jgi:hypothetical protein
VGADTTPGKALILFSPLATVIIEWGAVQLSAAVTRWEERRPFRQLRRTLKKAIKDQTTSDADREVYRRQLADLRDREIQGYLAAVAATAKTPPGGGL